MLNCKALTKIQSTILIMIVFTAVGFTAIYILIINVDEPPLSLTNTTVDLGSHKLQAFTFINNSDYLVVFESGLGNTHKVWQNQGILKKLSVSTDILLYDRAGYGGSESSIIPRGISQLGDELSQVIDQFADGRKVILVGHSLGGMIVRDYAIKNPEKTAAILFVDSSHEMYNKDLTQEEEDESYEKINASMGESFGGTMEARELIENREYMSGLPNLPDVPIIAITSMRLETGQDQAQKQLWYDSKEALREGVSDFTHITTTKSGHFIMLEEPDLVVENIEVLLSKLP